MDDHDNPETDPADQRTRQGNGDQPGDRDAHSHASQTDDNVEAERLSAALVEIEHFVAGFGWDQPSRLFALVPTAELLEAEPTLRDQLVVNTPDQLSSVEQDDFHPGSDLLEGLATIGWPDSVAGAAITTERTFLPADIEDEIPDDPQLAAEFVAGHPRHEEIRVVIGVMRNGIHYGVARLASNPDDLLAGDELVPALSNALARTFHWEENEAS